MGDDPKPEVRLAVKQGTSLFADTRLEHPVSSPGNADDLFERNILLQKNVDERTAELAAAMKELRNELQVRTRTEGELKRSIEFTERIYKVTPSAIFTVDREKRIMSWNDKAAELTGYAREDVIGKACHLFAENPCKIKCGLFAEEVPKPIHSRECTLRHKDGRLLTVSTNLDLLLDNGGQIVGGIESFVDITLNKRAEEAETANRAKSEFLANMSHELRTPLNHIIGFTELIVDRIVGSLNATQEEYLNDVLASSRHLLSLINDILDISKIEAGKMEPEVSEIAFLSLLENSTIMIKEKAMKHGIKISTRFMGIPPIIRADERKMKQILYNLLSNAIKFTPDGGSVQLGARKMEGQGVEITVSDTGIGVPESDLERIFQPFEQGDNPTGRKYQGTGLGLSLTRKMVELHGGRIWAESKGPGAGSTFTVALPS